MSRDQLIAHVHNLEACIQQYEDHVGERHTLELQVRFGLTKSEAHILATLVDGRCHTKAGLQVGLYGGREDVPELKIIDVFVCKIRRKIKGSGITVKTVWGEGYIIEDPGPLREVMAALPAPAADEQAPAGSEAVLRWVDEHRMNGKTVFSVTEMSGEAGDADAPAALRFLERRGHVEILRAPQVASGHWVVRVTDAGRKSLQGAA
jgi:two-component system cell cycle response regulator CtrA